MDQREEKLERDYLILVMEKLRERILELEKEMEKSDRDTVNLREQTWEEMPRTVRSFEDLVNLSRSTAMLGEQERSAGVVRKELREHVAMLPSPYFGRIDFEDEQDGECFPVYIGKSAFLDKDLLDFYVYDWRAPISSMFYDYDRGPAQYQSPEGIRKGNIPLKRQYRVRDGELEAMFDADTLVRDEILGIILSEKSEGKLKVIASSIQKEQNAAIRCLERRDMLVLGPAGSGKTSVGLHRMAYLLYHNRKHLKSSDIMVVSANRAFHAYIANIMPDLNEDEMRGCVFHDMIRKYIPPELSYEGFYGQFDALLGCKPDSERVRWIELIYSPRFLTDMKKALDGLMIDVDDVHYGDTLIFSKEEFLEYLAVERENIDYATLWGRVRQRIRSEIDAWFIRNRENLLSDVLLKISNNELDIDPNDAKELDNYINRRREECVATHRKAIRDKNGLDARKLLIRFIREYCKDEGLKKAFFRRMNTARLYYEDALALLCVRAIMGEIHPIEGVRLVLIDEAQDYGPPHHFLFKAFFPRADFTLLADAHQAVLPQTGLSDAADFETLYPGRREFRLTKSYRCAGPIGELAAMLIAHREKISWFEREGMKPAFIHTDDLAGEAARLCAEAQGTVAVLTATMAQARSLSKEIGFPHTLVTAESDEVEGSCVVMPVCFAKGLEFDRVILADCHDFGAALERNMLYLMCTRALHELFILYRESLPGAFQEWNLLQN